MQRCSYQCARCTRGGDAPNIITDLWDIGVLVAQIIQDDRTLNQYVVTIDEVLSQNEINATVEQVTGERVEQTTASRMKIGCRTFLSASIEF